MFYLVFYSFAKFDQVLTIYIHFYLVLACFTLYYRDYIVLTSLPCST